MKLTELSDDNKNIKLTRIETWSILKRKKKCWWRWHASRTVDLIQFLSILFMKWSDDEEFLCYHNTNSFSSSTLLKLPGFGKISVFLWSYYITIVKKINTDSGCYNVTCISLGWSWSMLESWKLAQWHSAVKQGRHGRLIRIVLITLKY